MPPPPPPTTNDDDDGDGKDDAGAEQASFESSCFRSPLDYASIPVSTLGWRHGASGAAGPVRHCAGAEGVALGLGLGLGLGRSSISIGDMARGRGEAPRHTP